MSTTQASSHTHLSHAREVDDVDDVDDATSFCHVPEGREESREEDDHDDDDMGHVHYHDDDAEDDDESIVLRFETRENRYAYMGAPLRGSRERPVESVLEREPVGETFFC